MLFVRLRLLISADDMFNIAKVVVFMIEVKCIVLFVGGIWTYDTSKSKKWGIFMPTEMAITNAKYILRRFVVAFVDFIPSLYFNGCLTARYLSCAMATVINVDAVIAIWVDG